MRSPLFLTLLLALGCGKSAPGPNDPPTPTTFLLDTKMLLERFQQDKKRSPNRLGDLGEYEPNFPGAVRMLNNGSVIYFWGNPLGEGNRILAYAEVTPKTGGPVLLEDGSMKEMTAAEFAAAPKCEKK